MKSNARKFGVMAVVAGLTSLATSYAVPVDLTTDGSSGTINGAHFFQVDPQPTGTGYVDPFVRINPGGNQSPEQGYNSSARPVMQDVNTSPQYTHDLQIGALSQTTYNGQNYYVFMLDINQHMASPLLSLDKLEIWVKSGSALTDANQYSDLANGGAQLKWNMDATGDTYVKLNYALNHGSGSGDMEVYIPVSAIGTDASSYLYLYSQFGVNYAANDGFEEWWAKQGESTNVPDGGTTVALLGLALTAIGVARRRFNT